MPETAKKWYTSKTVIFAAVNLIVAIGDWIGVVDLKSVPPEVLLGIEGVVIAGLRKLTKEPLG